MAQIIHNISTPNDGLGDELRTAMANQNSMNTELYTNKVDKVTGKQLSTNDFTNAQVIKLANIEEGAEKNVQADWSQLDTAADDYIKNKPQQLFSSVGYFHYNDTATATTPLTLVADTELQITNNQLGAQTNLNEAPYGVTTVWNSTTNKFDFSALTIGDALTLRVDLKLTTTSVNQKYKVFLRVGEGGVDEYDLLIFSGQIKTISTDYQIVGEMGFSLDYQSHIDNPSVLYILSDDGGSVEVNGFYVFIMRKGVNLISGGGSTPQPVTSKVVYCTLADVGATSPFQEDIDALVKDWVVAQGITKSDNEDYTFVLVDELPVEYNFDIEATNWASGGITDEASFISFLEGQGATNVVVTDFSLIDGRLQCNLSFDGVTELYFEELGITKINNTNSLVNLTDLGLAVNNISKFENFENLVNLLYLTLNFNNFTDYSLSEASATSQPAFTNPCNITFIGNPNSPRGTNFETILLTKNATLIY